MKQLITILLLVVSAYISAQSKLGIANLLALNITPTSELDFYLYKESFEMNTSKVDDSNLFYTYVRLDPETFSVSAISLNRGADYNRLTYVFPEGSLNDKLLSELYNLKFRFDSASTVNGVLEKKYVRDDFSIFCSSKIAENNKVLYMYVFHYNGEK